MLNTLKNKKARRFSFTENQQSLLYSIMIELSEIAGLANRSFLETRTNKNNLSICYYLAIKWEMEFSKSECFQVFTDPAVYFFIYSNSIVAGGLVVQS